MSKFYENEDNLTKLCDFLRSSEGPPVREAVEMDKRVYYIKGACPCVYIYVCGSLWQNEYETNKDLK